jgi:hypothetical protein
MAPDTNPDTVIDTVTIGIPVGRSSSSAPPAAKSPGNLRTCSAPSNETVTALDAFSHDAFSFTNVARPVLFGKLCRFPSACLLQNSPTVHDFPVIRHRISTRRAILSRTPHSRHFDIIRRTSLHQIEKRTGKWTPRF